MINSNLVATNPLGWISLPAEVAKGQLQIGPVHQPATAKEQLFLQVQFYDTAAMTVEGPRRKSSLRTHSERELTGRRLAAKAMLDQSDSPR